MSRCHLTSAAAMFAAGLLLAGCAAAPSHAPDSTGALSSGYLASGVRSSIIVRNASYDRAIQCGGATARLVSTGSGQTAAGDLQEIATLGQAWLDNAGELGRTRGLTPAQVQADATSAGGRMSSAEAATVWTGCRTGK